MPTNRGSRSERRGAERAQRLLGPGTTVYGYVRGRAKARLTGGVLTIVGVFSVAFVAALSQGVVLLPGLVVGLVVHGPLRPPRPAVVTDQGVALFRGSALTDRPTKVLAQVPHAVVDQESAVGHGSKVELTMGPDVVTFKARDFARLAAAARAAATGASR